MTDDDRLPGHSVSAWQGPLMEPVRRFECDRVAGSCAGAEVTEGASLREPSIR